MRLCSYLLPDGTASYGSLDGETIIDAGEALRSRYHDLHELLAEGALDALSDAMAGDNVALGDITLLPPVTRPDKILCVGLNYLAHIQEGGREVPDRPTIFTRSPSSIVGHGTAMVRPKASDWFDFEGELAVVIGTRGRHISRDRALDHVAGYTCFNDGSVRDFQRHTTQFWAGKNFDRSGAMGPFLVTADAVGPIDQQTMTVRLNGDVVQQAPISDLAFDVPALIEYISTVTELLPGDIIATGTPSGVGMYREPKLFMKPGDRIEVDISGIGTLSNPIEDEA